MQAFTIFDKDNHLQPDFNKAQFEALHGWDLGWELLSVINIAISTDGDKELSKRFSPGQKALYFFWYLDGAVTNGGFVQFYWNEYRCYLSTILNGLTLIGDRDLIKLIHEADLQYLKNEDLFSLQKKNDDWGPLYSRRLFDEFDNRYYQIHDNTINLIEKYAKTNPEEFIKLK